jgi:hypothetical protein
MPRHFLSDPDVRPLVRELVGLVLHQGSVNAAQRSLVAMLADDKSEGWIYPNRLHAVLSADDSRAINSETLAVLSLALSRLSEEIRDPSSARNEKSPQREAILQAWEAVTRPNEDGDARGRLAKVAERMNLPPAVVLWLIKDAGAAVGLAEAGVGRPTAVPRSAAGDQPDWSFQDVAHTRCVGALVNDPNLKVGLVLPTGGGKTRVAMRIALSMLDASLRSDTVVLWITHRTRLRTQAHRELQRAITEGTPDLPEEAVRLLGERVEFCMVADVARQIEVLKDHIELVIVDEAHHTAADSYHPIFDSQPLRGLFLTATPNRTDLLPIGIDEVAYSITSRELFDRNVILEPRLETITLDGFDWDNPDELRNLADVLLERARTEFVKTFVAVSRVEYATALFAVLVSVLEEYDQHVLGVDDLGFVHGSGTSTGDSPEVFLDEFTARPRGLVVATSQLLGEGFDDPLVNAVVVTYPTNSMVQLMQVAGRCLRSAPGKHTAHVLQVKDSALAYHWEQGWLYQDISDGLRPVLSDRTYSNIEDLATQTEGLLDVFNVAPHVADTIQAALAGVAAGEQVALLFTGLPYDGRRDAFDAASRWNCVAVTQSERDLFLRVFNAFSSREGDVNDFSDFLRNYLQPDPAAVGRWKRYMDMLWAMSYAHREITGENYNAASARPYVPVVGTTWLRYFTFRYEPAIPPELEAFLADAINRDDLTEEYCLTPDALQTAIKVPLPLAGTIAALLDDEATDWLSGERTLLRSRLEISPPQESFGVIANWRNALRLAPVPQFVIEHFDRFIRTEDIASLTLALSRLNRSGDLGGSFY